MKPAMFLFDDMEAASPAPKGPQAPAPPRAPKLSFMDSPLRANPFDADGNSTKAMGAPVSSNSSEGPVIPKSISLSSPESFDDAPLMIKKFAFEDDDELDQMLTSRDTTSTTAAPPCMSPSIESHTQVTTEEVQLYEPSPLDAHPVVAQVELPTLVTHADVTLTAPVFKVPTLPSRLNTPASVILPSSIHVTAPIVLPVSNTIPITTPVLTSQLSSMADIVSERVPPPPSSALNFTSPKLSFPKIAATEPPKRAVFALPSFQSPKLLRPSDATPQTPMKAPPILGLRLPQKQIEPVDQPSPPQPHNVQLPPAGTSRAPVDILTSHISTLQSIQLPPSPQIVPKTIAPKIHIAPSNASETPMPPPPSKSHPVLNPPALIKEASTGIKVVKPDAGRVPPIFNMKQSVRSNQDGAVNESFYSDRVQQLSTQLENMNHTLQTQSEVLKQLTVNMYILHNDILMMDSPMVQREFEQLKVGCNKFLSVVQSVCPMEE
eukprot:TRINITY_DN4195_c1_g1_i1.p1 TRINITY_DN4195_c1_g1~~TRINITY_DN4195_c1_g1_i1.p1  ORF type:complete len:519 (+),score=57.78 TRINITY_DN4195_c1_g1_i1:86-1558(+)